MSVTRTVSENRWTLCGLPGAPKDSLQREEATDGQRLAARRRPPVGTQ